MRLIWLLPFNERGHILNQVHFNQAAWWRWLRGCFRVNKIKGWVHRRESPPDSPTATTQPQLPLPPGIDNPEVLYTSDAADMKDGGGWATSNIGVLFYTSINLFAFNFVPGCTAVRAPEHLL